MRRQNILRSGDRRKMLPQTKEELASYIDHTLLRVDVGRADVERLCDEAVRYGFCSVCVNPVWVELAADILHGSPVKVDSVVGFPLGADLPKVKALEAKELVYAGADEIDMVANIATILEADSHALANDLKSVLDVCRSMRPAVTLKVIIESASLNDEQIRFACMVAEQVGLDFVKTSTGLNPAGGAKVEDVRLMAETVNRCQVKAAGGVRDAETALAMIEAGATRIGASASVAIVDGFAGGRQ